MSLLSNLKEKREYRLYTKAYWEGFYMACKKLRTLDGRYAKLETSDIIIWEQFSKIMPKNRQSRKYKVFHYGYLFGVSTAFGYYNGGNDPELSGGSLIDDEIRIRKEFEHDKEEWENHK